MKHSESTKPALIILAGGHSSRMKSPKAFLEVNGRSFTELIAGVYSGFVDEMVLVLNSAFCAPRWLQSLVRLPENMIYITNDKPHLDRIHSLQLGAKASCARTAFVHNVDQPFVTREVILKLLHAQTSGDVIIPSYNHQHGHPVLINQKVLTSLRTATYSEITLKEFYSSFNRHFVDVNDPSILCNINTPEDLERNLTHKIAI